ncbi:TPA: hypothetical protein ACNU26_002825 [Aeromonas salmonicida]
MKFDFSSDARASCIIFIIGIFFSLGIIMNPGYFSHDEISWGLKAIGSNNFNFSHVLSYDNFHYRPLNFNLWLLLSHYFFDFPQLFHLIILSWGLANSIIFYLVLIRLDFERSSALIAAIVSTIMPSIVFVNGWIGTIADIAWLFFCLISFLTYIIFRGVIGYFSSLLLFIMALMFKETAVVYPGIVFIYLVYERFSSKRTLAYFFSISAIFIIYIFLRYQFLFSKDISGYNTSIYNIPERLLEYFIYPFLWGDIEIHGMLSTYSKLNLALAFLFHCLFIILLCEKRFIGYFYYLSLYFVTSVPMLMLSTSLPHYMYGAGFTMAISFSLLLKRGGGYKYFSCALLLLIFIHSVNVQMNFIKTGSFQNKMYTSIYSIIKESVGENNKVVDRCYLIYAEVGTPVWIAMRALYNINEINGIDISGNKIRLYDDKIKDNDYLNGDCSILKMEKSGYIYEKNN